NGVRNGAVQDGVPATQISLFPYDDAVRPDGTYYVFNENFATTRALFEISPSGIIRRIITDHGSKPYDDRPTAADAALRQYISISADPTGVLLISATRFRTSNQLVAGLFRLSPAGFVTHLKDGTHFSVVSWNGVPYYDSTEPVVGSDDFRALS